ncbi:hypothetical protein BDW59DRAFT_157937 [Aspergillus cavernicola]|uniref:Protein kinase domain-containing protein n=1 Tax=Aspergillus cavernicola TaxID=176166 RepID=A0ABR4IUQ9_9EURO
MSDSSASLTPPVNNGSASSTSATSTETVKSSNSGAKSFTSSTNSATSTGTVTDRPREVGAYEISIGATTTPTSELSKGQKWVISCHMMDGNICQLYPFQEPGRRAERGIVTLFRSTKNHLQCEELVGKNIIGTIQDRDLRRFDELFYLTEASGGQGFVVRWLTVCVEEGLLEDLAVRDFLDGLKAVTHTVHADVIPEYIVVLHNKAQSTCHWYSTTRDPAEEEGSERTAVKIWRTDDQEHFICYECFTRKDEIGHLQPEDVELFEFLFEKTKMKKSRFFIFRFLFACADAGLVDEKVIERLQPQWQLDGAYPGDLDFTMSVIPSYSFASLLELLVFVVSISEEIF